MCGNTPDHFVAFTDSVVAPSAARAYVRQHSCPDHGTIAVDALLLITSELVTNAVLYGSPPITVGLSCLTSEVRLSVSDTGPTLPNEQGMRGGLGLVIVARIAREWGTMPLVVGKEVWCRVPTGMLPTRTAWGSRVNLRLA